MASLKKLTWKKVGKGIGKVVDNKWTKLAAAGALGATGLGAPAAAAIIGGMSAGGKLAQGKRLTTALKGGAKDAALTYVGGKVAGKLAPKVGGLFKSGPAPLDMTAANQASNAVNALDMNKVMSGAGDAIAQPGRFRSIASAAGKFIGGKDGFDVDDVISLGKAAGSAYGAYDSGKRMNRLENIAMGEYNQGAPLRAQARQMLLDDSRPDLSSVFNAPDQRYRRVTIGSRV